jgi:hypothetical protein
MNRQKFKILATAKSLQNKVLEFKATLNALFIKYILCSALIIIFSTLIAAGGLNFIHQEIQRRYETKLVETVTVLEQLRQEIERSAYDKVRVSDATNILLALQNWNFDTWDLPVYLGSLKEAGFMPAGNILDPEFNRPYFYQRRSAQDYLLCIYLATGIWGTNTSDCPTKKKFLEQTATSSKPLPPPAPTPTIQVKTITIANTETGWLRVRDAPALNSLILTRLDAGGRYEVLEENEEWVKIKLAEPVTVEKVEYGSGWVAKRYTKE